MIELAAELPELATLGESSAVTLDGEQVVLGACGASMASPISGSV